MYISNMGNATKMRVKNLIAFIFENYNKQTGFTKKDSYYSLKK